MGEQQPAPFCHKMNIRSPRPLEPKSCRSLPTLCLVTLAPALGLLLGPQHQGFVSSRLYLFLIMWSHVPQFSFGFSFSGTPYTWKFLSLNRQVERQFGVLLLGKAPLQPGQPCTLPSLSASQTQCRCTLRRKSVLSRTAVGPCAMAHVPPWGPHLTDSA